jgi:hypothetical protein
MVEGAGCAPLRDRLWELGSGDLIRSLIASAVGARFPRPLPRNQTIPELSPTHPPQNTIDYFPFTTCFAFIGTIATNFGFAATMPQVANRSGIA